MQNGSGEHNSGPRAAPTLALALAAVAAACFVALGPLLELGPAPRDIGRDGIVDSVGRRSALAAVAGVAGTVVALASVAFRGRRRAVGGFGIVAAAALAVAASVGLASWLAWPVAAAGAASAAVGVVVAPWLRERGVLGMACVAAVVAAAVALARSPAVRERGEALWLGTARAAILARPDQRQLAVPADGLDPALVRALVLVLRHAPVAERVDLLTVPPDAVELALLREAGFGGFALAASGLRRIEPKPRGVGVESEVLDAEVELTADGPVATVRGSAGEFVLRTVTPSGIVPSGRPRPGPTLSLDPSAVARYRELVGGLPSGVLILCRVESADGLRASGWIERSAGSGTGS